MEFSKDQTHHDRLPLEDEHSLGAVVELHPAAIELLESVKRGLTNGPLAPSERLRAALLGRVIAEGDETTSDSSLRDALHEEDSAVG